MPRNPNEYVSSSRMRVLIPRLTVSVPKLERNAKMNHYGTTSLLPQPYWTPYGEDRVVTITLTAEHAVIQEMMRGNLKTPEGRKLLIDTLINHCATTDPTTVVRQCCQYQPGLLSVNEVHVEFVENTQQSASEEEREEGAALYFSGLCFSGNFLVSIVTSRSTVASEVNVEAFYACVAQGRGGYKVYWHSAVANDVPVFMKRVADVLESSAGEVQTAPVFNKGWSCVSFNPNLIDVIIRPPYVAILSGERLDIVPDGDYYREKGLTYQHLNKERMIDQSGRVVLQQVEYVPKPTSWISVESTGQALAQQFEGKAI